jgi:hypothetical protein
MPLTSAYVVRGGIQVAMLTVLPGRLGERTISSGPARANHQDLVTAFHHPGGKPGSIVRGSHRRQGSARDSREIHNAPGMAAPGLRCGLTD